MQKFVYKGEVNIHSFLTVAGICRLDAQSVSVVIWVERSQIVCMRKGRELSKGEMRVPMMGGQVSEGKTPEGQSELGWTWEFWQQDQTEAQSLSWVGQRGRDRGEKGHI